MERLLTSEDAAARLGITVQTLYVYVSRGLIESHRERGTRRSYFSSTEVDQLAERSGRRSPSTGPWGIVSDITTITPKGVHYRGELISGLIDVPFEQVAERLWRVGTGDWTARSLPVPRRLSAMDEVRTGVVLAGSRDLVRSDQRPEAICAAARRLLTGLARTLSRSKSTPAASVTSIAELVATAIAGARPSEQLIRAVNAMMVLLADHAMSPSTVAVRLAGSTRADFYSAMLAGLGVLAGPFYGGGSEAATRLVRYAAEVGAGRAIDEELRWRGSLPGFGIPRYPDGDPRFRTILPLLESLLAPRERELANELLSRVERQQLPPPNMDLALALLVYSTQTDTSFGPALFSIARVAGWAAHYREELEEPIGRYYQGVT